MTGKKHRPAPPPPPGGWESPSDPFVVDLYIRVSTDKQAKDGDSLEEQESELKKFCDYRNFKIRQVLVERGKSAKNTQRPEYKKLVADIQAGKIKAVVVKKLDRLSRSLVDFEQLMGLLQTHGVEFISLRENFDTTTAMGKAMLRIALVFAQLEREQTAERVKDIFSWRAEQGFFNGGIPPFGYESVKGELVPHKQERKAVHFLFETFLNTESTSRTAVLCNAAGFRQRNGVLWDKRFVHKVLTKHVYAGLVFWKGTVFEGVHQPLVAKSMFENVQTLFQTRNTASSRSKIKGWLAGVLRCGHCQSPWVPTYTSKKGKKYHYYRCRSSLNPTQTSCKGHYLGFETTHATVLELLLSYSLEPKLSEVQNRIHLFNDGVQTQLKHQTAQLEVFKAKLATIRQRREHYLDSLLAGNFTEPERKRINQKIDEFHLEEKQLEAAIWRQELDLRTTEESQMSFQSFKEQLLTFRLNHATFSPKDWKHWFTQNITHIDIVNEAFTITFKALQAAP
ncbi:MAG: recombinase family protein [Candidatus Margulisiibacteriota bacterium]